MWQLSICILQGLCSLSKRDASQGYCAYSQRYYNDNLGNHTTSRYDRHILKKLQAVSRLKKRKSNDAKAVIIFGKGGTRTEHFLTYISNVIDVVDRNAMKGHYLLMDERSYTYWTNEEQRLQVLVSSAIFAILGPYWRIFLILMAGVSRNALTADDELSDHICEAVRMVTQADCQAWIRHAVTFFARCKRGDMGQWEDTTVYFREVKYSVAYIWLQQSKFAWTGWLKFSSHRYNEVQQRHSCLTSVQVLTLLWRKACRTDQLRWLL
jgi:hypothetical protein